MKKMVTLGVLGLATLGATQTAKADEAKQDSVSTLQASRNDIDPIQKAKNDVYQAQNKVNEQQNIVNQVQNETTQVQNDVEQKQNLVNEKQATQIQTENAEKQAQTELDKTQKIASDTTPEKIKETQDVANAIEQKINEQQKNVTVAKKEYESAKQEVDKAQEIQSNIESAVNDAEAKVNDAQKNVDNSDARQVQSQFDQAQANLTQVNSDKASIEKQINDKNDEISNDQNDIVTKQGVVDQAESDLNNANDKLIQANSNYSQALTNEQKQSNVVIDVQDKVNSLEEQTQGAVTVPEIPQKALQALLVKKPYKGMEDELYSMTTDDGFHVSDRVTYHGAKSDKNRKVDPLNLSKEDNEEINTFAANIVNQIREQAGVTPVKVSQGSMEYAKEVATKTTNGKTHDKTLLANMQKEHNVISWENIALNYMNQNYLQDNLSTMYDLKKNIYESLLTMIFADGASNYGHAYAILTSDKASVIQPDIDPDNIYLGVAVDRFSNIHFEFINRVTHYTENLSGNTTEDQFDTQNLIEIPDQTSLLKELNTQKKKLATETAIYQNLKSITDKAEQALAQAMKDYETATRNVSDAKQALNDTHSTLTQHQSELALLKQNLSDATDKVAVAQDNLKYAQEIMEDFNTDVKAKLANLQQAKNKLNQLNGQLDSVRVQLSNIQAKADNKKSLLENELNKLGELETKLSETKNLIADMQNADSNLKNAKLEYEAAYVKNLDAKSELENAKKDLLEVQAIYATTNERLSDEYDKLGKLQYEFLDAKSAFDKLINLKNEAEKQQLTHEKELARLESQFKIKDEGVSIINGNVADKNGQQVIGWTVKDGKIIDPNGNEFVVTKSVATNSTASVSNGISAQEKDDNSLPQLGDKNQLNLLGLGIAMILGALGLRRKKKTE